MAKSITIAEGTQAKNFNNVNKLRTNLIGGGTQYWVPEDEAGAYANMGQKTITANGTYRASDDSKDGYSQVTVNVPPKEAHLITKSITENGIYRGIDDGVDGFSQVNVNVAGVGEATVTLDEPIGGDGNEHFITTNPSTGSPIDVVLPSSIKIITPASKLRYNDGENIDITGIVVQAYKKDGTVWEDATHTGGYIPISELIFEPKKAHAESESGIYSDDDGDVIAEMVFLPEEISSWGYSFHSTYEGSYGTITSRTGTHTITRLALYARETDAHRMLVTEYNNRLYYTSVERTGLGSLRIFDDTPNDYVGGGYVDNGWGATAEYYTVNTGFIKSTSNPVGVGEMKSVGQKITIKWNRPRDNQALMVNYGVTVYGTN